MDTPSLRDFHLRRGARLGQAGGEGGVQDYGDAVAEYGALVESAGVLDLSRRGRLSLTGPDRVRFLHGQVTNDVRALGEGEGCYAFLVNAKGRVESDLHVYRLPEELLLDVEPGYGEPVARRLERFIIADDVQVTDVAARFGVWSVQGPRSAAVAGGLSGEAGLPNREGSFIRVTDPGAGDSWIMRCSRFGSTGFDLFVPPGSMVWMGERLLEAANAVGGRLCGEAAAETRRIEAGVARYGVDIDESNLAPETGLAAKAISSTKGCYVGQEVISRVRTRGQVTKTLRRLVLADGLAVLPARGEKLFQGGHEAGYVTSVTRLPGGKAVVGLGYVRREVDLARGDLVWRAPGGESVVRVAELAEGGSAGGGKPRPGGGFGA